MPVSQDRHEMQPVSHSDSRSLHVSVACAANIPQGNTKGTGWWLQSSSQANIFIRDRKHASSLLHRETIPIFASLLHCKLPSGISPEQMATGAQLRKHAEVPESRGESSLPAEWNEMSAEWGGDGQSH